MTCTFPTARGLCGRSALAVYTRGRETHPRCRQHDTIAARWYASTHVGWTRSEVRQSVVEGQGAPVAV